MDALYNAAKPRVVAIGGPTATGKTALSVALAKRFGGEIISADSMQIYQGLDVGTAKVTPEEMQGVPHHLVGFLAPEQAFSVADFTTLAGKTITQLTAQGKLPLVVGGTGLYITSLLNGIGFTPEKVDPAIRQELQARLQAEGSQALYAELAAVDPGYAAKVHPNNTPRVIRALELYRATGLSALPITHNAPTAQADIPPEQTTFAPAPASLPLRVVGEVFKTYIITERNNELCLIDKHAAHERILFEQLAKDYGSVPSQMLLVPVQVNLSAEEKQALLAHQELLQNSGVEVDDYGGFTVVVRAVPADVPVDDVGDMVLELANHLLNGGRDALREKTEWVLHSIACRAAIKAGDRTTTDEMLALAQKIMDGSVPPFCPHGRPCVLKLTRKELEKQFGRLV